jgi:heterodisulfide reductase subunit A
MTTSGLISEVNETLCIGCGKCEEVCPYQAVELREIEKSFEDITIIIKKSYVNSALCKGCGTCGATCPVGAISVKHYDFNQIGVMIDSYLLEKSQAE